MHFVREPAAGEVDLNDPHRCLPVYDKQHKTSNTRGQ
jgi:hypothetical protein